MDSIFSIKGLTFKEANLLFCLEKEIIENDISFSQQNDSKSVFRGKGIWFSYWQKEINEILKDLTKLSPKENLSLSGIDKRILYDEVSNQITNKETSWYNKIFKRCCYFTPYNWADLIHRNKNYINNLLSCQCKYSNLKLNKTIHEETLGDIAVLLLSNID